MQTYENWKQGIIPHTDYSAKVPITNAKYSTIENYSGEVADNIA
ncbi:MAG: hypothetical protein ACYDIC_15950 [Desulfobaccales bacterium]